MDPLNEVLQDLRLTQGYYCHSELHAPWGVDFPDQDWASFHFMAEGRSCVLLRDEVIPLEAGDFVLMPLGRAHGLADSEHSQRVAFRTLKLEAIAPNAASLRVEGRGERSVLICGGARFSGPAAPPLLAHLPELILVRKETRAEFDWLRPTLEAMAHEVGSSRPGAAAVMTRLADILVIQAVRTWAASEREAGHGWLAALRDPQVGRSLALMHREPGKDWDIEGLARAVGMSRAVFAERFASVVGQPPKQYLTEWRMHLASHWLHEERLNLAQVADRLGYGSEAAFSRAFKRHYGEAPGGHRRRQRSTALL